MTNGVHDEISGQGYDYHEIVELIVDMSRRIAQRGPIRLKGAYPVEHRLLSDTLFAQAQGKLVQSGNSSKSRRRKGPEG
jgi:hypothetical protein